MIKTIKELKESIEEFPDNYGVRILSQSLSNIHVCIMDTQLDDICLDENHNVVYLEIGEFDEG